MNRFRFLAIATVFLTALGALAQQPADEQFKLLTDKLELTSGQQTKVKQILHELNSNSSGDQKAARMTADRQIRAILKESQRKKLDQLEQEYHPELHGEAPGVPSTK